MTDIITKTIHMTAVVAVLSLLAACGSLQSAAGLDRRSPDEFAVMRRAPLTVPPDFRLADPADLSARQSSRSSDRAKQILTGDNNDDNGANNRSDNPSVTQTLSDGEASLLSVAGATQVDPSIRQEINQLDNVDNDRPVIEQLQFWRDSGRPPGKAIDPSAELKRLQDQSTATPTSPETPGRDGDPDGGDNTDQSAPAPAAITTPPPLTTPDNS